jgi:Tol biopolymer transport system component
MNGGIERPLTEGTDFDPKFSPDGSNVLFLRADGTNLSAYRVPVLGGSPRRVIDAVAEVCWSPDGQQLAYTAWAGTIAAGTSAVRILDIQSGEIR